MFKSKSKSSSPSTPRRYGRRVGEALGSVWKRPWVRVTFAFVACLYAFYVLAAWALLSWGGLEAISGKLEDARFRTESGHSFWPGHVSVSGVEVVFQDDNLTIQILAQEAELNVGLGSALAGEVHLQKLVARGTRFRMRHRVKSNLEGHKRRIDAFPTIEGFERSALRGERSPRSESPVVVRIENIDASLDEIWIMEYRTRGDLRARGGFSLTDEVRVHPSFVDLSNARSSVGEHEVLSAKKCEIDAGLGPFPRRQPKVDEILGSISAEVDCSTKATDLSFMRIYPRQVPFEVEGELRFDVDARLEEGQMTKGEVRFRDGRTPWTWRGVRLPTTWEATIRAKEPGHLHGVGTISIHDGQYASSLERAEVSIEATHQVLHRQNLERLRIEVRELAVEDERFLQEFTASARAPRLRVHPSSATAVYAPVEGSLRFEGRLAASLNMGGGDQIGGRGDVDVDCKTHDDTTSCETLTLHAAQLTFSKNGESATLPLDLSASDFDGRIPERFDATFDLRAGNPKEFLQHALGDGFLERLGIELLPLGEVNARLHLNKDGGTLAGNLARLDTGAIEVLGRFVTAETMTSAWQVETPVGRYGIRQSPTKTRFHPLVDRTWFSSCEARLGSDC